MVTPEIEELLADIRVRRLHAGERDQVLGAGFLRRGLPPGSTARLVVDTAKLHFFDPETGKRIGYRPGAFAAF